MTTTEDLVAQVRADEYRESFSPTRYPYTYAADFMRQNPGIVPNGVYDDDELWQRANLHYRDGWLRAGGQTSRSEASSIRQAWARLEGRPDDELAIVLADAYLQVHQIERMPT